MGPKLITFVLCALLGLCHSAYVDTIKKCSIKDDECFAETIQSMIEHIDTEGIEELNMRAVNHRNMSGLSVSVSEMFNLTVLEGYIKGVKDCVINHAHNNLEARETQLDLVCDVTVNAKLKFDNVSPDAQKLFGAEDVSGNGNFILKIEKIHIKMTICYNIVKKDNGDIYISLKNDDLKSDYEIENLHLKVDKLFIGKQDLSEFIENFVNKDWKFLVPRFGNSMFDGALTIVKEYLGKFFDNVPCKYYLIEDLTPYL